MQPIGLAVGVLVAIFLPWYLVEVSRLASELRTKFPSEWEGLGRPSAFDASTQGALLAIIFGTTKLPAKPAAGLADRLERVRMTGVFAAVAVLGMFLLPYFG